jgi:hypothetical protein
VARRVVDYCCVECHRLRQAKWKAKAGIAERLRLAERARYWSGKGKRIRFDYVPIKQRSIVKRACPDWADHEAIRLVYERARMESQRLGKPCVVVHDIPLRGRSVCGLHVMENLRVVSRGYAKAMGRRFDRVAASSAQMRWLVQNGLSSS